MHLQTVGVSSLTGAGVDKFFVAVDQARQEYEKEYLPRLDQLKKDKEASEVAR